MEKTESRRIQMTKALIRSALVELMGEKTFERITIKELCEQADVNRTTFYKYYSSQFDLLADMEKDLIDFISKLIERSESDPGEIIAAACRYLEENLSFARLIVNNNVDPLFPQKLFSLEILRENVLKNYANTPDAAMQEYLFNYVTYGAYRLFCVWLNKEQRESPEEIAQLLVRLIQLG